MGKNKDNKAQGIDGIYVAEKKDNGKYTIKDVPVFAEVKEEGTKLETKITPDILKKIVARAQLRAGENYFPPLHINHHDDSNPNNVIPVGFFLLTRVGKITYEGKDTAVIFADLFGIEEHMFEMIKDVRFPYRSVEAKDLDGDEPEIIGLALLEHDTPFFRLPLLTIKQEIDKSEKQVALSEKGFARAYQYLLPEQHLCRVLFSLGGIMAKKTKKTTWERFKSFFEDETEEQKKKREAAQEEKDKKEPTDEEKKKLQEEDEKKDKEFDEKPDDEKIKALYGLFKDIMKKLGTAKAEDEDEKPKDELEDDPEKQKKTGPVELQLANLEGQVTGLTDKLSKIDKKETKKDLIAYGKKKLVKYNLTDIDKKLEEVATHGKVVMDAFIVGVEERGTTDPSVSFDKFTAEKIDNDPLMIEFAQKDPKVYAKAVEANTAYKALGRPDIDRRSFIKNFMATDGSSNPVEEKIMV